LQKVKKVVVVRANSLDRETRATKLIKSLTNAGFLVKFLGWNRGFDVPRSERSEAGAIYQEVYLNLKAPWGNKSIFFLPIWWIFVFFKLMTSEWDAAHAIQIISIPPTLLAGKIKRKKVIYDLLDTYEDSMVIPRLIRDILMTIDKILIRLSDSIVLADEEQIKEFRGIPNSDVTVIYDSPSDIGRLEDPKHDEDKFTLFFAGLLYSGKMLNLDKIFAAIKDIEDLKLVIAGHGDLVNEIRNYEYEMPDKIKFIGEISHNEVIKRSYNSDLLFMIRDSLLPVNKYICGSKVLESMMCGKPILVSSGTSTARKVTKENCGLVIDAKNVEDIKKAIIKLKNDPDLCNKLGSNARKAYEESYGWHIMEKRLLELYTK
jgi:glycosyltransferase involved in cell wall biosynthesis